MRDRRGINVIDYGKIEPENEVLPAVKAAFEKGGAINSGE